ncbi:MAG: hypothetical protein QG644_502 [Patescibacteria group bacterium]|nr:hypothetical protein [Patescibacteria group bacterium]
MKIFKEIKSNIYDREYYKAIPSETFGKSLKYIIKLSFIAGLVSLIIFAIVSRDLPSIIKKEVTNLVNQYPEELVVTVTNGEASTNQEEPYMIPMASGTKEFIDTPSPDDDYTNVLVIDTKNEFSLGKLKEYATFAMLTKEEIVVRNMDTGEIRIFPLADIESLEINKSWLLENTSKVLKAMPVILIVIVPFIYLAFSLFFFVGTMIANLFFALLIWLISRIKKLGLTYKTSYQLGLHASTAYVGLNILAMFIPIVNDFVIKTLAVILVIWINFIQKDQEMSAPTTPPPPETPTN